MASLSMAFSHGSSAEIGGYNSRRDGGNPRRFPLGSTDGRSRVTGKIIVCQIGRDVMNAMRGNRGPRYKHRADETAPYETITIDQLTPIIGAEIGGIDLAQPLSNRTIDEVHRALAENLVIFFRDQHIT